MTQNNEAAKHVLCKIDYDGTRDGIFHDADIPLTPEFNARRDTHYTRTDLVQSQIDAAVTKERERCAEIVKASEPIFVEYEEPEETIEHMKFVMLLNINKPPALIRESE